MSKIRLAPSITCCKSSYIEPVTSNTKVSVVPPIGISDPVSSRKFVVTNDPCGATTSGKRHKVTVKSSPNSVKICREYFLIFNWVFVVPSKESSHFQNTFACRQYPKDRTIPCSLKQWIRSRKLLQNKRYFTQNFSAT